MSDILQEMPAVQLHRIEAAQPDARQQDKLIARVLDPSFKIDSDPPAIGQAERDKAFQLLAAEVPEAINSITDFISAIRTPDAETAHNNLSQYTSNEDVFRVIGAFGFNEPSRKITADDISTLTAKYPDPLMLEMKVASYLATVSNEADRNHRRGEIAKQLAVIGPEVYGKRWHYRNQADLLIKSAKESLNNIHDRVEDIYSDVNTPIELKGRNGRLAFVCNVGGRPEKPNEDRVLIDTDGDFYAVIDGMGGHSRGDMAAQIFAEELRFGANDGRTFEEINQKTSERILREVGDPSSGAAYLSFNIHEGNLKAIHAGDVKLLLLNAKDRDRKLQTQEQRAGRARVFNVVTGKETGKYTVVGTTLQPGDRIIVASDGLWDNIENNEKVQELIKGKSPGEAAKILQKYALEVMTGKREINEQKKFSPRALFKKSDSITAGEVVRYQLSYSSDITTAPQIIEYR